MTATRRDFLATSAAAVAATTLFRSPAFAGKARQPLRILILGGTGFVGPACTESALARGHSITLFNSGRTEERRHEAGRPSVVPQGVEVLYGNRDPNKTAADRKVDGKPDATKDENSPKGLSQLVGKKWDAVIDTCGYFPRMVKASAELLAPNVRQYIFISTISVYKDTTKPGYDENTQLATLSDPNVEEMGKDFQNYGGGKAACERAAEAAMPGRVSVVRPGFIVGPRDTSGRFIYYPVRASMGGMMAVPGRPADPIQIIDVRDLTDWMIRLVEDNVTGIYNATGPAAELSMIAYLHGIRKGIGSNASFTWIEDEFLKAQKIGENQFPLWAPPTGETAGFHRCNIGRALSKGLTFRALPDTAKATLDWYKSLPPEFQAKVAPQFAKDPKEPNAEPWLEREKRLLASWQSRDKK